MAKIDRDAQLWNKVGKPAVEAIQARRQWVGEKYGYGDGVTATSKGWTHATNDSARAIERQMQAVLDAYAKLTAPPVPAGPTREQVIEALDKSIAHHEQNILVGVGRVTIGAGYCELCRVFTPSGGAVQTCSLCPLYDRIDCGQGCCREWHPVLDAWEVNNDAKFVVAERALIARLRTERAKLADKIKGNK